MSGSSQAFTQRLTKVFELTLPKLGPEARRELEQLVTPESLAIASSLLTSWVIGHAIGIGEIVDVVVAVVGWSSLGFAVFSGIDELFLFARLTYSSTGDLDQASGHLAKAIDILGIQSALAILFRNRPRMARGQVKGKPRAKAVFQLDPPPPVTSRLRYRPTIVHDPLRPVGTGETDWWGDITLSTKGSNTDRALVELHERVHQFICPKLYLLRNVRVLGRTGSYVGSSLYRYLEEAMAETIARVGVQGFRKSFIGIRFPIDLGYLYLMKAGADPRAGNLGGRGLLPEGAALLAGITSVGLSFGLWFKSRLPSNQLDSRSVRKNT